MISTLTETHHTITSYTHKHNKKEVEVRCIRGQLRGFSGKETCPHLHSGISPSGTHTGPRNSVHVGLPVSRYTGHSVAYEGSAAALWSVALGTPQRQHRTELLLPPPKRKERKKANTTVSFPAIYKHVAGTGSTHTAAGRLAENDLHFRCPLCRAVSHWHLNIDDFVSSSNVLEWRAWSRNGDALSLSLLLLIRGTLTSQWRLQDLPWSRLLVIVGSKRRFSSRIMLACIPNMFSDYCIRAVDAKLWSVTSPNLSLCNIQFFLTGNRIFTVPDTSTRLIGAAVAERLACSLPTKANRVQFPAGSPDFRKWKSCQTMPLVGGFFSGFLPFPPPLHSGTAPYSLQSHSSALKTSLQGWTPSPLLRLPECSLKYHLSRALHVPPPSAAKRNTCVHQILGLITGDRIAIDCPDTRFHFYSMMFAYSRHDGNIARLALRSDDALGVRVSVTRIAPSLLDLGRTACPTPLLRVLCTCAFKVKKRGSDMGDTNTHAQCIVVLSARHAEPNRRRAIFPSASPVVRARGKRRRIDPRLQTVSATSSRSLLTPCAANGGRTRDPSHSKLLNQNSYTFFRSTNLTARGRLSVRAKWSLAESHSADNCGMLYDDEETVTVVTTRK
ncbi:hypothetical protein PR048_015580 [Dryococelus australis]|uniref:Uncharacterized protein n=1 Tax=Dryococelus australis TaxID=614101 RepID=A0ABQ9HHB1_9NEOP|nr:hypothetical protein PR048_015580 [Dryococelus australis]